MIHLMLNDLCRPASVCFNACLHFQGLILHLDGLISLTLTWAAEKRQATFLGVICAVFPDDLGIEHHRVCRSSSALIEKGDNALKLSYHIRRHSYTPLSMCMSVSSKSCATGKSCAVAGSDFLANKIASCIISFTITYTFLHHRIVVAYRLRLLGSANSLLWAVSLHQKQHSVVFDLLHIRRHADAAFPVCHQRIKQVLCDLQIFFCCDLRLSCKEYRIVHQFFYHFLTYILLNY